MTPPQQVHGRFATVTLGAMGTNLNFSATDIRVVPAKGVSTPGGTGATASEEPAFSCEGKFVPMQ
jgi:polygalacturonase